MIQATHLSTAMLRLEVGAFRLVTDPTLDPEGTRYHFGPFADSCKTEPTAMTADELLADGPIDAVLVSHHHHTDNLDYLGRELLERSDIRQVITHDRWPEDFATITAEDLARVLNDSKPPRFGPSRWRRPLEIADKLVPLAEFATHQLDNDDEWLRVTCVPALHGRNENWRWLRPFAGKLFDRRTVGFLLEWSGRPGQLVYLSGDTIWFPGIPRIAEHVTAQGHQIAVAFLHGGCVGFPVLNALGFGPHTFDGEGMIKAAETLNPRVIVPIHYDGWQHFREPKDTLRAALEESRFADRVRWLEKGRPTALSS